MEFIQRQHPTSDESPPWAGITFKLPIDSDMLAERLRSAYPQRRTLRERKHQATIDFFLRELNQMQSKEVPTITIPGLVETALPEQSLHSSTTFNQPVSEHSRPRTASECTSPSITGTSSSPRSIEYTKPILALAPNTRLQPPIATTSSSQFVWSAHDGTAARPKTKRKMTIEERSAYKETRKRGACSKCRKQKGKCTHMVDTDQKTMADESTNSMKRRISSDFTPNAEDGLKTVKTEHASDVHHATLVQPLEHISSISAPTSTYENRSATQQMAKQLDENPQVEVSAEESSQSVATDHESSYSRSRSRGNTHDSSKSSTPTNSRSFSPATTATTTNTTTEIAKTTYV